MCPEQNSAVERMNRTLLEMVYSMLVDSKLPQRLWAEALSTGVYLQNRCPTRAVPNMTPYEVLTGTKPKVGHLHVFLFCILLCTKNEQQKLDLKSQKCVSWDILIKEKVIVCMTVAKK